MDCGGKVLRDAALVPRFLDSPIQKRRRGVPCRRSPNTPHISLRPTLFLATDQFLLPEGGSAN